MTQESEPRLCNTLEGLDGEGGGGTFKRAGAWDTYG